MTMHLLERSTPHQRAATAPAIPRHSHRRPHRALRAVGRWTLNLALVVGIVAFLGLAVGPHVFGYRTVTMLTSSMTPMIEPGDVIVTFPKPASEVEVGDVITYHIPVEDQRIETHRVTKVIERHNGEIAVRTKGDANDVVDPWTAILDDDTVWETRYVVPNVGHAIRALRTPWVQDYAWYAAIGGVLLIGLRSIWARPDEDDDAPTPAEPALAAEPTGTAPLEDAFDVAALRRLAADLDDDEYVTDFAGRYQQLLPGRIDKITAALTTEDLDAALDATLSLKVTSSTVGTRELRHLAEDIEQTVRRHDVASARELATSLAAAAARADAALTAYLRVADVHADVHADAHADVHADVEAGRSA